MMRPPEIDNAGDAVEHFELFRRETLQLILGAAPANVRVAPQRAESRAGSVEQHRIKRARNGSTSRRIRLYDLCARRAQRLDGAGEEIDPSPAKIGGHDDAAVLHRGSHRGRFSARRGAGVQNSLAGHGACEFRHELRGFVLHEEDTLGGERRRQGIAATNRQPVRCKPRRLGVDAH